MKYKIHGDQDGLTIETDDGATALLVPQGSPVIRAAVAQNFQREPMRQIMTLELAGYSLSIPTEDPATTEEGYWLH
ncbi:hypothetical protein ACWDYH_00570 [Nocardia goodfellowii]